MKTVTRMISSAVLVLLTAILTGLAAKSPALILLWWPKFSAWILGIVSVVSGAVVFPLWEAIAVLLLIWLISTLIRGLRKRRFLRWLSGVVWGAALAVFFFVLFWGVGHFLPTKTEQIVTLQESSAEELQEAAVYYGARASLLAEAVERTEDGLPAYGTREALSAEGNAQLLRLSQTYDCISAAECSVKNLLPGKGFSYLGITGMFVPYTAEAAVNPDTYAPSIPFTVCHELAHRAGACGEEDANFCGFLACVGSADPAFQYSGWYSAFLYCYNALCEQAPERADALWNTVLSQRLKQDIQNGNDHYRVYEGTVQNAAQKVNDAYLKSFGQEGVRSYGMVSDALIAWYKAEKNKIRT